MGTGGDDGEADRPPEPPSKTTRRQIAEGLAASRERGRRDALERISRFPEGPPRQRAASTLVVTLLQQFVRREGERLERAYVEGVIEVVEQVIGGPLDVPIPPTPGSPDAGSHERNEP